jgi:hypothetical protein
MRFVYVVAALVGLGFMTWVGVLIVTGIQNWMKRRGTK